MTFKTQNKSTISWMREPSAFVAGSTIERIQTAGRWDEFLELHADEDGVVDCDKLYDYLRYSANSALQDVGLHNTEGEATVLEVIQAWGEKHAEEGLKVSYLADKVTPSGIMLFDYGRVGNGIELEFDAIMENGEIESVSLDAEEILALVGDKAYNNATTGAWTSTDDKTAVFEMWREE